MQDESRSAWAGVQVFWIVLGFLGAALGVSSMPTMSKKQMFTAVVSGLVCSALAPQWAAHYYARIFSEPIPAFMNNTVAFVFGVGGMFIVPGLIVGWQRFKENPFVFIDYLRGKGPPPAAPAAPPKQSEANQEPRQ